MLAFFYRGTKISFLSSVNSIGEEISKKNKHHSRVPRNIFRLLDVRLLSQRRNLFLNIFSSFPFILFELKNSRIFVFFFRSFSFHSLLKAVDSFLLLLSTAVARRWWWYSRISRRALWACMCAMLKSNNKTIAKAEDYSDGKQIVWWCKWKANFILCHFNPRIHHRRREVFFGKLLFSTVLALFLNCITKPSKKCHKHKRTGSDVVVTIGFPPYNQFFQHCFRLTTARIFLRSLPLPLNFFELCILPLTVGGAFVLSFRGRTKKTRTENRWKISCRSLRNKAVGKLLLLSEKFLFIFRFLASLSA